MIVRVVVFVENQQPKSSGLIQRQSYAELPSCHCHALRLQRKKRDYYSPFSLSETLQGNTNLNKNNEKLNTIDKKYVKNIILKRSNVDDNDDKTAK